MANITNNNRIVRDMMKNKEDENQLYQLYKKKAYLLEENTQYS